MGRLEGERPSDSRHVLLVRNLYGGMAFGMDRNPRLAARASSSRRSRRPQIVRSQQRVNSQADLCCVNSAMVAMWAAEPNLVEPLHAIAQAVSPSAAAGQQSIQIARSEGIQESGFASNVMLKIGDQRRLVRMGSRKGKGSPGELDVICPRQARRS